jgi:hypothetical protein
MHAAHSKKRLHCFENKCMQGLKSVGAVFSQRAAEKKPHAMHTLCYTLASDSDNNFVRPFTRNSYGVMP